jgi:homoserine kinase
VSWPDRAVVVRVPATSANLGPGFDSLGLALARHDVVTARIIGGGLQIEVSGAGECTATAGEDHLVVRAMRAAFAVLGGQPPGIAVRCRNAIPQGYGLGSSAGAIVAGLLAARELAADRAGQAAAKLPDLALLSLAAELEGHPDNVAACLAGGLTIAWCRLLAPAALAVNAWAVSAFPLNPGYRRGQAGLPAAVRMRSGGTGPARLLPSRLPPTWLLWTPAGTATSGRAAAMPRTAALIGNLRSAGIPRSAGAGPAVLRSPWPGGPRGRGGGVVTAAEGPGRVSPWAWTPGGPSRAQAATADPRRLQRQVGAHGVADQVDVSPPIPVTRRPGRARSASGSARS